MPELIIESGEPSLEHPASFTRFMMPFGFHLEHMRLDQGGLGKPYYSKRDMEQNGEEIEWRKRYLTSETARALFERSSWLGLNSGSQDKAGSTCFRVEFKQHSRPLKLTMKRPIIVLLEQPELGCAHRRDHHHLLRTGFLILEVYFNFDNARRPTLDNLLELNDLFRYHTPPYAEHGKDHKMDIFLNNDSIRALLGEVPAEPSPPHAHIYSRWEALLKFPVFDKKKQEYYRLIPQNWWPPKDDGKDIDKGKYKDVRPQWNHYADDRAFVWSCAVMPDGGGSLAREFGGDQAAPHKFGHWVKFLNVDPPGASQQETHSSVRKFERKWAKAHTYHRWQEWGTYYGFNYHSGVLLTKPMPDPPVHWHFNKYYFDFALLLFYLRVTLFRFSTSLFEISAKARHDHAFGKGDDDWESGFDQLRQSFTIFTNLYQFPLISNQQQAVEMYALARKHFDVDELYEEVRQEIHNTHDYLLQKQQQKQTKNSTRLTWVATFGLALNTALTYFALGRVQYTGQSFPWGGAGYRFLLATFLISLSLFFLLLCLLANGSRIKIICKRIWRWLYEP